MREISYLPEPPLQRKKLHVKGKQFSNQNEEEEYLLNLLSSPPYTVKRCCILQFLRPVYFAAKNSRETRLLVKKYEKALTHITTKCSGRNILEILAERL